MKLGLLVGSLMAASLPPALSIPCANVPRNPQTQPPTYIAPGVSASRHTFEKHEAIHLGLNNQIPQVCDEAARVVTYNVHYHRDLHGKHFNTDMVKADLSALNPAVVILQEVKKGPNSRKFFDAMLDSVGLKHRIFAIVPGAGGNLGNMIASKYPLEDLGYQDLGSGRVVLAAGLNVGGTRFAVVGTHLEVSSGIIRQQQAQDIVKFINTKVTPKYPNFILGGDMNGRWSSQEIQTFAQAGIMREAFNAAKAPYPQYTCWSGTTIDFLFVSNSFQAKTAGAYSFHNGDHSDHLPIVVDMVLDQKVAMLSVKEPKNGDPALNDPNKSPKKGSGQQEPEGVAWDKVLLWSGVALVGIGIIGVSVYFLCFRAPRTQLP